MKAHVLETFIVFREGDWQFSFYSDGISVMHPRGSLRLEAASPQEVVDKLHTWGYTANDLLAAVRKMESQRL